MDTDSQIIDTNFVLDTMKNINSKLTIYLGDFGVF